LVTKVTALYAAYGILAAVTAQARGRLQAIEIEVPMFETMVSFILNEHLGEATFDAAGKPGYDRLFSEHRRPYRTRDGWIWLRASGYCWVGSPHEAKRNAGLYLMARSRISLRSIRATLAQWIAAACQRRFAFVNARRATSGRRREIRSSSLKRGTRACAGPP